jgi:putative membrane protein insertion efficiency factor
MSVARLAQSEAEPCVACGVPPLVPTQAPSPAAWLVLLVIGLYRRAISPLLPPACRFVPTCSEYGYEAVARYGILAGGRLAVWRILRCNPFGGSGYDPVPSRAPEVVPNRRRSR